MLPVLWCGRRLERVVTRGSSVRTWPSALAAFSATSTALGHLLLGLAGPACLLLLQATPATWRLLLELAPVCRGHRVSPAHLLSAACAPAFRASVSGSGSSMPCPPKSVLLPGTARPSSSVSSLVCTPPFQDISIGRDSHRRCGRLVGGTNRHGTRRRIRPAAYDAV